MLPQPTSLFIPWPSQPIGDQPAALGARNHYPTVLLLRFAIHCHLSFTDILNNLQRAR